MLNFLFELKDFREISLSAAKHVPKLLGTIKDAFNRTTKSVAEAHLMKSFVVDPLVSDVKEIIGQAQRTVMDVQDEFRVKGLLPNARHFSKPLHQMQSLTQTSTLSQYLSTWRGTKHDVMFTATMESTYGYKARNRYNAYCQFWGLVPTAEAVWNATPFSFLVDYVFDVGHSLNLVRKDPNVALKLNQYCESISSVCVNGTFIGNGLNPTTFSAIIDDRIYTPESASFRCYPHSGLLNSSYTRLVKPPNKNTRLPELTFSLSDKQMLNVAALARVLL